MLLLWTARLWERANLVGLGRGAGGKASCSNGASCKFRFESAEAVGSTAGSLGGEESPCCEAEGVSDFWTKEGSWPTSLAAAAVRGRGSRAMMDGTSKTKRVLKSGGVELCYWQLSHARKSQGRSHLFPGQITQVCTSSQTVAKRSAFRLQKCSGAGGWTGEGKDLACCICSMVRAGRCHWRCLRLPDWP